MYYATWDFSRFQVHSVAFSRFTIIINQHHLKSDTLSILFLTIKYHTVVKYTDQSFSKIKKCCSDVFRKDTEDPKGIPAYFSPNCSSKITAPKFY